MKSKDRKCISFKRVLAFMMCTILLAGAIALDARPVGAGEASGDPGSSSGVNETYAPGVMSPEEEQGLMDGTDLYGIAPSFDVYPSEGPEDPSMQTYYTDENGLPVDGSLYGGYGYDGYNGYGADSGEESYQDGNAALAAEDGSFITDGSGEADEFGVTDAEDVSGDGTDNGDGTVYGEDPENADDSSGTDGTENIENPEDAENPDETAGPDGTAGQEEVAADSTSAEDQAAQEDKQEDAQADDQNAEQNGEAAEEPAAFEQTALYKDIKITAAAEAGVLPDDARIQIEEILPVTQEKADAYAEAITSLSMELQSKNQTYSSPKVYDIHFQDAEGAEIEPKGDVKIKLEYTKADDSKTADTKPALKKAAAKLAKTLSKTVKSDASDADGAAGDDSSSGKTAYDVAHLTQKGKIEMMNADVETTAAGEVKSAEFTADSFSYYIMFGSHAGSNEEPINAGEYGWLKFYTPEDVGGQAQWGHYGPGQPLPATNTEEGYHRILQVKLHILNSGGTETAYDTDYTEVATNEYFWTWENRVYISDFYVPGYEVVQTKMHTAWDDAANDKYQDSLVGNYSVRGYRSSDGTSSDLNVLDVYMKSVPTPETAMRYIIRYVHADGSVTDGNVRYLASGTTGPIDVDKPRDGERFSGIAVAAGADAVRYNTSAKTVTFNYDSNVDLAKAYIYFENAPTSNTSTTRERYDKTNGKYYNGQKGLYTEKNAETVANKEREFLVNLEAWYIDNGASVGMILDASGSMAWTAGIPAELDLDSILNGMDATTRNRIIGRNAQNRTISATDLNLILNRSAVDNSNNGYNSYKYYVYTGTASSTNPINEYAPLGYSDGRRDTSRPSAGGGALVLGNTVNGTATTEGYADTQNYGGAGWYYVNPSTSVNQVGSYGGKRFEGIPGDGAAQFWVRTNSDGSHTLMCRFDCGSNDTSVGPRTQISPVYAKRDQMMTKAETLQDSIAQFGAILNGASPGSEVAISRFSHTNFSNLNLLNWTTDSEKVAAALNISDSPGSNGNSTKADGTYQYIITGGTVSRMGFENFSSVHKTHADTSGNYKYIILFTDGKDQGPSRNRIIDRAWLNNNGYGDYKIITMFMRSAGMSDQDVADSREFLSSLASGGKNGDPNQKLCYEATSNNPNEIVDQFRQIAQYIVTGLQNYSVKDYIDPRFDVINEAGDVLSVLDENGQFTHATNPDVDAQGFRGFTTPDGKQAQLGYDREKKMFYVLWQHQDIQASPVAGVTEDATVTPWQSQIRLQAKKDFIGGNDVLTNGNTPTDNLVYKPVTDSNGNAQYDSYGRERVDETATRKSFPFASVNPGLLDVALGNYEDTIFLGEEITPGDLLSLMMDSNTAKVDERSDSQHRVADTAYNEDAIGGSGGPDPDLSSRYYIEYLERLGKKLHNNKDYYGIILRHVKMTGENSVGALVTALKGNSNYTVTEKDGQITVVGKENTIAKGEKITIIKTGDGDAMIKLELPYYYLESPTDTSTYAGPVTNGVDPQEDQVGIITYKWELKDFASNTGTQDWKPEENDFVKFDTYVSKSAHMDTSEPVKYQFSISYEPLGIDNSNPPASSAVSGDDGSNRTRALTGQSDPATALIRDAVGTVRAAVAGEQSTTDEMGWAVIHAVDGRILIEKRMLTTDFNNMKSKFPDASITLTLTGSGITSAGADEAVWTKTLTMGAATAIRTEGLYTYIVSEWADGLPVGQYTLSETVSDHFADPEITGDDNIVFETPDAPASDPAYPYSSTVTDWKANYSGATWNIGMTGPSTLSYTDTDYTYGKVAGDLSDTTPKNIDPLLKTGGAKNYLNAQIGRARVTNAPATTSITVSKTWEGITPAAPIVVQLTGKLSGSEDKVYYAELNAGNNWSATIDKLDIDNTVYTAVEGTGTVGTDGTCTDFAAFDTAAAHFTFDGKTYKQTSLVYTDKVPTGVTPAVEPRTDAVVANAKNDSGSIAFTNTCVTKVAVEKKWEGITPANPASPEKPLVIQLHPSTGSDYFVELNPGNSWKYTFEDIPAATGLTYTITEGTGTVANDGTCADFTALPTSGNFTFDGKTYRQKENSLKYTPAVGAENTTGLDGSVSPDAGKAEVTNEALTEISVEKVWEAPADPGSEPIYIQLYKGSAAVGNPVALQGRRLTHTFDNLKVETGVTYSVKEGKLESGTFEPYEGTFELNGQKMQQKSITFYSDSAKTTEAQGFDVSVSPFGGAAVIVNSRVLGRVKILKTDADRTNKKLKGVSFELIQDTPESDGETSPRYNKSNDTEKIKDSDNNATFVTDGDGIITLPDLAPGDYWLVETKTIRGYEMPVGKDPALIRVDNDANVTLVTDSSLSQKMTPTISEKDSDSGYYTVTVPNQRVYMLPRTGGGGIVRTVATGASIAGFFLVLLAFMRKKSRLVPARADHQGGRGGTVDSHNARGGR